MQADNNNPDDVLMHGAHQPDEISLLELIITIVKHKWFILLVSLSMGILAGAYSLMLPNIYTATTQILPPQQESTASMLAGQLGALAGMARGSMGVKGPDDLYIGILKSRTVADHIIAKFHLRPKPSISMTVARAQLASQTSIKTQGGIIAISVNDRDPQQAAAIANDYVQELQLLGQTLALSQAAQRRIFFERQTELAKDSLSRAENDLQKFQENTGIIKLDEQSRAMIDANAQLHAEIAAKEVQLDSMRAYATAQNPDYQVAADQLAGLRTQLARLTDKQQPGYKDILVPTGNLPSEGLDYARKLREVKYQETIFELMAKQYELAKIEEAKNAPIIQVLDQAVVPDYKTKPYRSVIVIIACFFGLICSLIMVFLKEGIRRAAQEPRTAARFATLKQIWWKK